MEQSRSRFTLKDVDTAARTLGFGVDNVLGVDYDDKIPDDIVENAWRDDPEHGSEVQRPINEAFRILAEIRGSIRLRKMWEASKNKDRFEAGSSSTLPNPGFSRQISEVNTTGAFHEKAAGRFVSGNLSDVQSQIQNLRRDVDHGFDQMDKRIDAQQQDLRSFFTNSVATLNDHVQSQSYSLLALQNSGA